MIYSSTENMSGKWNNKQLTWTTLAGTAWVHLKIFCNSKNGFFFSVINAVVPPALSVVESMDVEEPLVPRADSKFWVNFLTW